MKPSALRELTIDELRQKDQDLRRELFNLRFRLATGEVENPMRIRAVRKDIARVLTVIAARQKTEQGLTGR
ncbi:MAG TPA: 50S ribosomal protein L29 [Thermodesulfovibrionales bacterium]|nr:50S ribosomal protein L29 [Thermodesulfovibrionales bacterium]